MSKYLGHEVTQKAGPPLLWGQAGGPGVVQPGDEKTLGTPHRTLRGLIKKGETDFTQTDSSKKWGKGFKIKEERFKWDIRNKFFTKQWWDTGTGCSKKLWMALCMPFNLGLHAFLLLGTFSWNGSTLSYASLSICRVSGIFQRKRKEGSGTMGVVYLKNQNWLSKILPACLLKGSSFHTGSEDFTMDGWRTDKGWQNRVGENWQYHLSVILNFQALCHNS